MRDVLVIGLLIGLAIFSVFQLVSLIKDIASRRKNKSAATCEKDNGLKGDK